jgi:uncharacterized membrane protein
MDSKFSTVDTVRRTPSARRDLSAQYLMWGNTPTQKRVPRIRPPMHPRIIGFGATLLMGAFATDIAYAQSDLFQWENFSIWLVTAGLALAAAAAVALVFDAVRHRITAIDWARFCGFTGAILLSIVNALVHSRDSYTAVVPQGLILSGIVAAILLALGWRRGWSVGVASQSSISPEGKRS